MAKAWCSTAPPAGLWTAVYRQMTKMGRRGKDVCWWMKGVSGQIHVFRTYTVGEWGWKCRRVFIKQGKQAGKYFYCYPVCLKT